MYLCEHAMVSEELQVLKVHAIELRRVGLSACLLGAASMRRNTAF